jgi:hypothetical protein
MKINLECDSDVRSGYININPTIPQGIDFSSGIKFSLGNYKNFGSLVDDNSVEEIIYGKPLNTIVPVEIMTALKTWHSKLKQGAIVKIFFNDIRRISKAIFHGNMPLENVHELILGTPTSPFVSIIDLPILLSAIKDLDFTVDTISPSDFSVSIVIKKN